ncbi:pilus assembly protein PilM [bacterium]|nr:pilus assembly protein PilM [bacterium]
MFLFEDSMAVDIRSDFLYIALVGKSLSGFHLIDVIAEPLPDENAPNRDMLIVELLRLFCERNKRTGGEALCSIPRKFALIRFMSLPVVQRQDVNKLIRFEAERHVPGHLEDYCYDTHVLEEKLGTGMKVLFVAVPREIVSRYVRLLNQADIRPSALDISGFNALNTITFQKILNGNGNQKVTAFVQMGRNETELTLLRGRQLEYIRTLKLDYPACLIDTHYLPDPMKTVPDQEQELAQIQGPGPSGEDHDPRSGPLDAPEQQTVPPNGTETATALSDDRPRTDQGAESFAAELANDEAGLFRATGPEGSGPDQQTQTGPDVALAGPEPAPENGLTESFDGAELVAACPAFPVLGPDDENALEHYVDQLAFNIDDSQASSGLNTTGAIELDQLLLVKSAYTRDELVSRMVSHMNTYPLVISSLDQFKTARVKDPQAINDFQDLSNALGLTLRNYMNTPFSLNFLPPELRIIHKKYGLWISLVLIGLIFISLLTWNAVSAYNDSRLLDLIKVRTQELQPQIEQLGLLKDEIKQMHEMIDSFAELEQKTSLELEILTDLSERIPKSYWLNYLLLDKTQLTMHGMGESPESLVQIIDASPYLEAVKLERVVEDRFTIEAQIEEPKPEAEQPKDAETHEEGAVPDKTPAPTGTPVPVDPAAPLKSDDEKKNEEEKLKEEAKKAEEAAAASDQDQAKPDHAVPTPAPNKTRPVKPRLNLGADQLVPRGPEQERSHRTQTRPSRRTSAPDQIEEEHLEEPPELGTDPDEEEFLEEHDLMPGQSDETGPGSGHANVFSQEEHDQDLPENDQSPQEVPEGEIEE